MTKLDKVNQLTVGETYSININYISRIVNIVTKIIEINELTTNVTIYTMLTTDPVSWFLGIDSFNLNLFSINSNFIYGLYFEKL